MPTAKCFPALRRWWGGLWNSGLFAGGISAGVGLAFRPVFFLDGTIAGGIPAGLNWAGRASETTLITGPDGLVETIPADCLAMPGYRLEHNLVTVPTEDMTDPGWTSVNGAVADAPDVQRFTAAYGLLQASIITKSGHTYVYRVKLRWISGNKNLRVYHYNSATGSVTNLPSDLTSNYLTYSVSFLGRAGGGEVVLGIQDANSSNFGSINIAEHAAYDVTGRSNQNPPEYVSAGVESSPMYHGAGVDGYKYFDTENGNTVNPDGSINEATGAALPGPLRLRLEPTATNYFLNSSAPVTQTVTLTNGNEYTFQVVGTGSMALSGGATGTVTEGSPVTATVTGDVTCTIAGSVDYAQVEDGAIATSIIITGATADPRAADAPLVWTLTTPQAEGMVVSEVETLAITAATGSFASFEDNAHTIQYQTAAANTLTAADGTNTATVATTNGADITAVATRWTGTEMQISRKHTTWTAGTAGTYDGAFATDDVISIGYGIEAPLFIKSVSVYDGDRGTDWIEANFP